MRAVGDTNVLVSAILRDRLLEKVILCVSKAFNTVRLSIVLVVIAKRLSTYENRQQMDSEEFFDRYSKGQLPDDALFVEWANDYHHYFALRREIEKRLQHAA
jgi:hypothetical protein